MRSRISSTRVKPLVLNHWFKHGVKWQLGESNGTPLWYTCLENPLDGGPWWAVVHGVAKSWAWLSDFTFTFHFPALEEEMATHSSVLAWRIPGTGEPGGLPSMGSRRVGHDWSDLAAAAGAAKWQLRLHGSGLLESQVARLCKPAPVISSASSNTTTNSTELNVLVTTFWQ